MSDERKDREDREEEAADRGFKVEDRRRFDPEGNVRPETPETAAPGPENARLGGLPELDFSTFILSLATEAMVHLGEAQHPDGTTRRDLGLAKQTIDLLSLLRDKTQGNLTSDESRLIDEMLYDLRLRFCAPTP